MTITTVIHYLQTGMKKDVICGQGTCAIFGDSILRGIDETYMSSKRLIKFRSFPGATVKDVHSCVIPLICKQPDNIILLVTTNDVVIHDLGVIVKDLLNLKGFIEKNLPNWKIILSCSILPTDLDKYLTIIEEVNKQLAELSVEITSNDNIKKERHTRKGLLFSKHGIKVFAMNLIRYSEIRNKPHVTVSNK